MSSTSRRLHGLNFAVAAALYGCERHLLETGDALHAALDAALASTTTTILEIRTDRGRNRRLHRDIEGAVLGKP